MTSWVPVYVRDNTLLALGSNSQKPDCARHGTAFQLFHLDDGCEAEMRSPLLRMVRQSLRCRRNAQSNTITVSGEGGRATGRCVCVILRRLAVPNAVHMREVNWA